MLSRVNSYNNHAFNILKMAGGWKMKRGKLKPSDVVRQHYHQLWKALDVSDNPLQYFTGHLNQEEIIDAPTKIEVLRKNGFHGADGLLNIVRLKVDLKPIYLETVLMEMKPLTALQDIAEKMEQELAIGRKRIVNTFHQVRN